MKLDVGGPCDYDVTKKEFQMCKVWVFQNLTSQHKIYIYSMSARRNVSMVRDPIRVRTFEPVGEMSAKRLSSKISN
jgi:hypothetical protein